MIRTEDQCVHRSKLEGVVGTLFALQAVCKAHGITQGWVTAGLECEDAIKKGITSKHPPGP